MYALLLRANDEPLVIPALNRDGDTLSDMVLQMFGSSAGAESRVLALDEEFRVRAVMAEAPHGTAPGLYGKNVANPVAMILAAAAVLSYAEDPRAVHLSEVISHKVVDAVRDGARTADLGGHASTSAFTDEIIRRVRVQLEDESNG